ncbi:hypothetical protein M9H77_12560 [Catharanthus roseus]|uniref:Uncharacterized protein n=1 Tax=Catharanthus roseus TaxID=4058 RepID=A0ACC0BHQ0_CATRO|nr:hypothetical protein M9H77_12560 [Catharanthus roseus]
MAMKVDTYLIVTWYLSSRKKSDRRPYVTLGCERGGANKPRMKPRVDNEEEEAQVKRQGPYETKKCGCPFKLKSEQMAMCENWQLFIHDERHNHAIGVDGMSEVLWRPLTPRDDATTTRPSTRLVLSVTGPKSSSPLRTPGRTI